VVIPTNALGCQLGKLLFTYLGLPLGTTKPSIPELSPILTRMEKHLMDISRHLSYAGRPILVNSVFSALPTYCMCSLKLPVELLKKLINTRNMFFGIVGMCPRREAI
jgi:hypothetical protein